jgi:hypothetical protein
MEFDPNSREISQPLAGPSLSMSLIDAHASMEMIPKLLDSDQRLALGDRNRQTSGQEKNDEILTQTANKIKEKWTADEDRYYSIYIFYFLWTKSFKIVYSHTMFFMILVRSIKIF